MIHDTRHSSQSVRRRVAPILILLAWAGLNGFNAATTRVAAAAPDLEAATSAPTSITRDAAVLRGTSTGADSGHFEYGKASYGISLDGVSDSVFVSHEPVFNEVFMTVAAWVKAPPGAGGGIVNKYLSGSRNGFNLFMREGRLHAWYFRNSTSHVWGSGNGLDGGVVADGEWHHVAFSVDTSGGYLYLDGELVANRGWTGSAGASSTTLPLRVGFYPPSDYLETQVDEVMFFNTDLSVSAVRGLMERGLASVSPSIIDFNLQLYLPFNEGEGVFTSDASGRNRFGTFVGEPDWEWNTLHPLEWTATDPVPSNGDAEVEFEQAISGLEPGGAYVFRFVGSGDDATANGEPVLFRTPKNRFGTALELDGLDDLARVADIGDWIPSEEVTVEFWQRVDRAKTATTFSLDPDPLSNRFNGHTPWSNNQVYWDFGNIDNRLIYTPPDSPVGMWTHFAMVASKSGNFARIYRDGVLEAQKSAPGSFTSGVYDLLIGNGVIGSENRHFDGVLDEFRIWSAARTEDQIRQFSDVTLVGDEEDLVLYLPFDEGTGDTAAGLGASSLSAVFDGDPVWVASGAEHRALEVETLFLSQDFGVNELHGSVRAVDLPTMAWFEWGREDDLAPAPLQVDIFEINDDVQSLEDVDFDAAPILKRTFDQIQYSSRPTSWRGVPNTFFATRHTGILDLEHDGVYSFFVLSRDGSALWIDGERILDNDGRHDSLERAGSVTLAAGEHTFELRSFNSTGTFQLIAWIAGPNLPRGIVSESVFNTSRIRLDQRTPEQEISETGSVVNFHTAIDIPDEPGLYSFRAVARDATGVHYGEVKSRSFSLPAAGNQALRLDGRGSYFRTPELWPNLWFDDGSVTVEFWFKANGPGVLVSKRFTEDTNWAGSQLELFPAGVLKARAAPMTAEEALTLGTVEFGTWNHIVYRYNNATRTLDGLLNGVPTPSESVTMQWPWDFTSSGIEYFFGFPDEDNLGNTEQFDGVIDEVRIWNVARTNQQISEHIRRRYERQPGDGLVAYYRFPGVDPGRDETGDFHGEVVGDAPSVISTIPIVTPPNLASSGARSVMTTSATLTALVVPSNAPTSYRFFWGRVADGDYTHQSEFRVLPTGIFLRSIEETVSGLEPGVEYHYGIEVLNDAGSAYEDANQHFTTLVPACGWPVTTVTAPGRAAGNPSHATDVDGNVLLAGQFSGSLSLGGASVSAAGSDGEAFVARIGPDARTHWIATTEEGSGVSIETVLAAPDGGVIIAGTFTAAPRFGEFSLSADITAYGFVAALDRDGQWAGAWRVTATNVSQIRDAAIDVDGNVIVAGLFSGTLNPGGADLDGGGGLSGFVAMLSPDGDILWARRAGEEATAIAMHRDGSAWVGGVFSGNAQIGAVSLTSAGDADFFVGRIRPDGEWEFVKRGGGIERDTIRDLASGADGEVYATGAFVNNSSARPDYDGNSDLIVSDNTSRAFVTRLDEDGRMSWFAQATDAMPFGLSSGTAPGGLMWAATFSGNLQLGTDLGATAVVSNGAENDIVVARLNPETGEWIWAKVIGGSEAELGGSVSVDPSGMTFVSGRYQGEVAFGSEVQLSAIGTEEIFLAQIEPDGGFRYNRWIIGEAVLIPDEGVDPSRGDGGAFRRPEITLLEGGHPQDTALNSFEWDPAANQLYAIRPVRAQIKWYYSADIERDAGLTCIGVNEWPREPRFHIAGAPTDLAPDVDGFAVRYMNLSYSTSSDAAVDAADLVFTASESGYSVIQFLETGGAAPNPAIHPSRYDTVLTVPWNDSRVLTDNQSATIGTAIEEPSHEDPAGGNGYLVNELSVYDGALPNAAHDRGTRTGPIIPVNRDGASDSDDLVVAWYSVSGQTGVAWPSRSVRYLPDWPADPRQIILSNGLGSGELPPDQFPEKQVYNQPNPELPGRNPNEEHALLRAENHTLYALRNDLNATIGLSEPYTLLKYRDPETGVWRMDVFQIVTETDAFPFVYDGVAGFELRAPDPLGFLGVCPDSHGVSGPWFEDVRDRLYARAAGLNGEAARIVARNFYPWREDFYYDLDGDGAADVDQDGPGRPCLPWLDRRPGGEPGVPIDLAFDIVWPEDLPELRIGETLITAKNGLPSIYNFAAAEVIFDEGAAAGTGPLMSLVRLYDPITERFLPLAEDFVLPGDIATANREGRLAFTDLPRALQDRLRYDPLNGLLSFKGLLDTELAGEPLLLPNVMTFSERDRIQRLSPDPSFQQAVDDLFDLTRNPNRLDLDGDGAADADLLIGLAGTETDPDTGIQSGGPVHEALGDGPKALTAGLASGGGYVTVIENNDADLAGLPIDLKIIRVAGGPYRGDLKVLEPENIFDERLSLRHSADFGGAPEALEFEWYYHAAEGDFDPSDLPVLNEGEVDLKGWTRYNAVPANGEGVHEITLGDATGEGGELLTLADHWFIARYRGYDVAGETPWSPWAGAPGIGRAQLAEGWVKRVRNNLNPFESRSDDFHTSETATFASMIRQAGERYEGDIPFNPDADNLNDIGLIEAYETVLRRARRLSIDAVPPVNYEPANNTLLLAAGRVAEFYTLLGNEAFADAADPTIGFRTSSGEFGTLAPTIFAFENQLNSLLEEELVLLRGRGVASEVRARPVYNRAFWNFTGGDGEVAYVQAYAINDQNEDGSINEFDGRILFPQGHGDAWGHYLSAGKTYYNLLRDPDFTWIPQAEDVLVAGEPVSVDYRDERKFARIAAAKAKTGSEIVDLTYRLNYVEDPAGQWQGYTDEDDDRAWGVSGWARRAAQAAYFDWVTANAILPATDPNPEHQGIEKIDRTTVGELDEIIAGYTDVQARLDRADIGLNPLGLAKGVVPFDIDPNQIGEGQTHFEQIYDRALNALENSMLVFDYANDLSRALRRVQDDVDAFTRNVGERERDFKNRMIEVFGYPYSGDIGPGKTYPGGYDGPDLYHYMYVETAEINGDTASPGETFTGLYTGLADATDEVGIFFNDDLPTVPDLDFTDGFAVEYPVSTADYGLVPPASWGSRRAPGELQQTLSSLIQKEAALQKALRNYDALIAEIQDRIDLLSARYDLEAEEIRIRNTLRNRSIALNSVIAAAELTRLYAQSTAQTTRRLGQIAVEGVPRVVGVSNDATAPLRASLLLNAEALAKPFDIAGGVAAGVSEAAKAAKDAAASAASQQIEAAAERYEIQQQLKALEQSIRKEAASRLEIFTLREAVQQEAGHYQAVLARGMRLIEERVAFRRQAAADTQENRYQDMTFRVFRNAAIQKYRAQFDLAARYVYLAGVAYDFETQLLGGANRSGREFLTDIIRQRSLGQIVNGRPVVGQRGLADPLARLDQNFAVLKGQLGFNNPQTETGRFSLRAELFRIRDDSDEAWRAELTKRRVDNLWALPEFRRYCRPFAPESAGAQPAIVIRFPTTVTFGLNYFRWPLSGGDSAYDPTRFATKVRSAGVWFSDYLGTGLSQTPRVYLVPAGADVFRSPSDDLLATREWRVVDQKLPVPFPLNPGSLDQDEWIPINDTLSDVFADIRRFSSFRAYHDSGTFRENETINNNRLIGRSVWNTDWILIIPGGTFLNDPDEGLQTFIDSVSDIKIFFQTYSFSGN